MLLRGLVLLVAVGPLFAGYVGTGVLSPFLAVENAPASSSYVTGTTTYTYSYTFEGFTDPVTMKPTLKAGSTLTVADPNGVPAPITAVQAYSSMQFDDMLSVTNPGPKISIWFDLSTIQSADPGFDWARTQLAVLMSGYDSNNDSQWSQERFFFQEAPGSTSTKFHFHNLNPPGSPGIGGNDIPASVVSFALSLSLNAQIQYSGGVVASSVSASVDATHTLVVESVTSLDQDGNALPGVTFGSEAGADYSGVPEPSTFAVVGSGVLAGAAFLRRRSA